MDNIEKLKQLRTPFPSSAISKLPRKYKDRQGVWHTMELEYVGHADLTERFLEVDPLWSWRPMAVEADGTPKVVKSVTGDPVGLWIILKICDREMIGYGSCESGKQDAIKELIGDALRNAGMRMGAALDLWKKTGPAQAKASAEAALSPTAPKAVKPAPKPAAAPKGVDPETGEISDQDLGAAIDSMFGGMEDQPSDNSVIYGVTLTVPYSPETALEQRFTFGKNSGKTIQELVDDQDPKGGRSYLEWMKKKTSEEYQQGKKPSALNQYCLIAYHAFVDGK